MLSDKEVKEKFKKETKKNPEKYFAVDALKREGFERKKCRECKTYFWTVNKDQKVCGDPACSGGFRFFEDNPVDKDWDYVKTWKEFSNFFESLGYTTIDRYPVAARWRDDTDFVQASIYDFQPWVVSGEVDPPANPLVVPQFCLRFNDIDNVGITMSHNTGFVMIGQHAFNNEEEWDQEKYFTDLLKWFTKKLGIPKEDLTLHEDAWAGGGNFGPCMEFFSKGLELGNQVYMMFEQTHDGRRELDLKVLDMGMGHERNAWFIKGEGTQYDATFPDVVDKLLAKTGVDYDENFIREYLPHGGYLNIDEVEDVDKAWERVADAMDTSVKELREKIMPLAALYSVAEHARSLLVALADGSLPGNVKGGYNLRTIYRRAQGFIDKHGWDVSMNEVCRWHAEYLEPLFPELKEHLDEVDEILNAEYEKYKRTKKRNKQKVKRVVEEGEISTEKLLELYDSHGIDPEDVKEQAERIGETVEIPDNFYALVSQRHEQGDKSRKRKEGGSKLDLDGVPPTKILYYDHYDYIDFEAPVTKIIDNLVVLEETAFYPTSGGQMHDTGTIEGYEVVDVFKQGKVIVHKLMDEPDFEEGEMVDCKVDWDRRKQLAQHHTATHIIGGVCRKVLGDHVWQAGAKKTEEKSRLDITHYENLDDDQVKEIEEEANRVIEENLPIYKNIFDRGVAQKEYGFRIYQGGAVPGKDIRIVEIDDLDAQACGGTHLNTTGEAEHIKIIKTSKVQDGVVRLEYVAGNRAKEIIKKENTIKERVANLLDCTEKQIPSRAEELFNKWKKGRKAVKKDRDVSAEELELTSEEEFEGDVIKETADILRTQPEHIIKTIKRFKNELKEFKNQLSM